MISHEIVLQHCPFCGYQVTLSTGLYQDQALTPEAGAASICCECGKVSVFDEQMKLRLPTTEEKAAFAIDPRILEAQIVLAGIKK